MVRSLSPCLSLSLALTLTLTLTPSPLRFETDRLLERGRAVHAEVEAERRKLRLLRSALPLAEALREASTRAASSRAAAQPESGGTDRQTLRLAQ